MIGVIKGCGTGMIRGVTPANAVLTLEPSNVHYVLSYNSWDCAFSNGLNWSQKRFFRGKSPSDPQNGEGSDPKCIKHDAKANESPRKQPQPLRSLSNHAVTCKFSRSLRGHQAYLLSSLPNPVDKPNLDLIEQISKLVVDNGPVVIRVKTRKHEDLLMEWIGIQREIITVKHDRIEDDRKRLQIAGQQVLREMAKLTKAINLDDLDQAIEGALCSQAKTDYGQQKLRDN
ncbi:unnamed protein product [Orchesella dallaii]|uniref:Uncharacterized protein n=1 Tax=Orchesella dallaii TaxID=48710 RepID=A0ABP1S3K1_9HEXA